MRTLKASLLAAVAALGLATAPADAGPHWRNHGFWGGPGLMFGIAGAVIAAGVVADAACVRYAPVYDDFGNYVGRRPVNAC